MEVFKYAVKFSDQPVADTWHAFQTLANAFWLCCWSASEVSRCRKS
jgi:hypothetical protein